MGYDRDIIEKIIACAMVLPLIVVFGRILIEVVREDEIKDSVYAGEIINKEIENAYQGLFVSHDTEYRIHIEFEYTYNDKEKSGQKYFTVDKETYLNYDIGDWFDSHNFE